MTNEGRKPSKITFVWMTGCYLLFTGFVFWVMSVSAIAYTIVMQLSWLIYWSLLGCYLAELWSAPREIEILGQIRRIWPGFYVGLFGFLSAGVAYESFVLLFGQK